MKAARYVLLGLVLVGLALCSLPVQAQVAPVTQRFTNQGSTPAVLSGLTGPQLCSFIFGGGSAGLISVTGDYRGTASNVTVTDSGGGSHTTPFTPSLNAQYYLPVVAYDNVTVAPWFNYSGDSTVTLSCVTAPVALATSAGGGGGGNVSVVAPTDASGFVKVNCETGCAGGGGSNVTIVAPTDAAGRVTVVTPAPAGTLGVVPQITSPVTTPSAEPWPNSSAGAFAPAQAPDANAYMVCAVNAGATPNATGGHAVAAFCDSNGNLRVNIPNPTVTIPVTTPAPAGTLGVVQQAAPLATTPVSCAAAANCPVNATQVTSPWVVTTINPSLPAPQVTWPVSTIAPFNAPAATASPNGAPTPLALLPVAHCAPTATVMTCQTVTAVFAEVSTINPSLPAPQVTWPVTSPAPCNTTNCSEVSWATAAATLPVTTPAPPTPYASIVATTGPASNTLALGYNSGGGAAPLICHNYAHVQIAATTQTTETVVVASAAGKVIYICSISMSAGGATTGFYGLATSATNTCGSLTNLYLVNSPGTTILPVVHGTGIGVVAQSPSGVALCFENGSATPTGPAQANIMYEQFLRALTLEELDEFCSIPKRCALYGLVKHLNALLDGAMGPP